MSRGAKTEVKCRCGTTFLARVADVKRGWGKFCSKSCKAKEQEKRTGQYSNYLHKKTTKLTDQYGGTPAFDHRGDYIGFTGLDPDHDSNKD